MRVYGSNAIYIDSECHQETIVIIIHFWVYDSKSLTAQSFIFKFTILTFFLFSITTSNTLQNILECHLKTVCQSLVYNIK